jgi:hypothetical protein
MWRNRVHFTRLESCWILAAHDFRIPMVNGRVVEEIKSLGSLRENAGIAQKGERKTEDLEAERSIRSSRNIFSLAF